MRIPHSFFFRNAKRLTVCGLAAALVFALLYKLLFKISFLMLCGCALGALTALWGGLHLRESRGLRLARRLLVGLLCLGLAVFAGLEGVIWAHSDGDPEQESDWLIVLGCGIQGETPSLALVSRLEVALGYLQRHPNCNAVLSGGQGAHETITEAEAMARWLKSRGIAPERLVLEEESRNTIENLQNSLSLIPPEATVTAVSNEFHLYRVQAIAEHFGRPVRTLPAPTPTILFTKVNSWLRESASIALMHLKLSILQ